jgi:hypothetical protein
MFKNQEIARKIAFLFENLCVKCLQVQKKAVPLHPQSKIKRLRNKKEEFFERFIDKTTK